MFAQSAPPHEVPQTMLSPVLGPHTTSLHFVSAQLVPQTMLSSSSTDPRMRLPQSSGRVQTVPHTTESPSAVLGAPQVTSSRHAFASERRIPPPMRWFPQLMCLFHGVGSDIACASPPDADVASDLAT